MGYLNSNNAPYYNNTGGGGGAAYTKINRGATKERRFNKSANLTIPAGWFFVDIINRGLENITINGDLVYPGDKWNSEDKIDLSLNRQELGNELNLIIAATGEASIHVCYPHDSAVDVSTF